MSKIILSCTTLLVNVAAAQKSCGTSFPVVELDRIYHDDPEKMREHILSVLGQLPEEVDTVLVAMGFCGGSWQNVTCRKKVVIPRVADCVALNLTTPDRYAPDLKQLGHMYMFGENHEGFSTAAIYESLLKQYDEVRAKIVFDMYFDHYYHLDVIDNGLYDCYDLSYAEHAQSEAEKIQAELDYVPGSNILLEQLLSGEWDEKFLVAEPGEEITQGTFY